MVVGGIPRHARGTLATSFQLPESRLAVRSRALLQERYGPARVAQRSARRWACQGTEANGSDHMPSSLRRRAQFATLGSAADGASALPSTWVISAYGIFNGSRFRHEIAQVAAFVRAHDARGLEPVALAATAATTASGAKRRGSVLMPALADAA